MHDHVRVGHRLCGRCLLLRLDVRRRAGQRCDVHGRGPVRERVLRVRGRSRRQVLQHGVQWHLPGMRRSANGGGRRRVREHPHRATGSHQPVSARLFPALRRSHGPVSGRSLRHRGLGPVQFGAVRRLRRGHMHERGLHRAAVLAGRVLWAWAKHLHGRPGARRGRPAHLRAVEPAQLGLYAGAVLGRERERSARRRRDDGQLVAHVRPPLLGQRRLALVGRR